MADCLRRLAKLDEGLAELMPKIWAAFRQGDPARAVDRRTRKGISSYIEGLRTESPKSKTFSGLAQILAKPGDSPHLLANRLQHVVTDRCWDPDAVLEAAALCVSPRLVPTALILRNVHATRLGEHRYRLDDLRDRQRSMLLALAAAIPEGEATMLILRWRLAIEHGVWGERPKTTADGSSRRDPFTDFKVPHGAERVSIAEMGAQAVADARCWPDLDLPVVAGGTYSAIRYRWRRDNVPYVVEWVPKGTRGESLQQELRSDTSASVRKLDLGLKAVRNVLLVDYGDQQEVIAQANAPAGHRDKRVVRTWCTNMFDGDPDAPSVVRAVQLGFLRFYLQPTYQRLREQYGLNDYRGTSYDGWHRHAALVALAHTAEVYGQALARS
jgi:hypothetical protein